MFGGEGMRTVLTMMEPGVGGNAAEEADPCGNKKGESVRAGLLLRADSRFFASLRMTNPGSG